MATTIEQSSTSGAGSVREVEVLLEGVQTPRRMQNPSDKKLGIVRHQFDVPVRALAGLGIYSGPNPRKRPRVKSRVAQLIERSLLNQDDVVDGFHLAHLGITVVATSFEKVDDREDAFHLKFLLDSEDEPSDGIVNGLHTLSVIDDVINSGIEISPGQYVSFTVITGIDTEDRTTVVPFIAKGRNTVLQVKTESIDNLMGRFDTLKTAIPDAYQDKIGWEESAGTDYDVIDVLAVMTALNSSLYPNDAAGGDVTHPVIAADHKRACLKRFEEEQQTYDEMAHMLPEALHLYDLIRSDARDRYNTSGKGRRGGRLRVMRSKKDRRGNSKEDAFTFPFYVSGSRTYGRVGTYELIYPAAFAVLAAFRNFVERDEDDRPGWKGGFGAVERAWEELGAELVVTCQETAETLPEHKMAVLLGRNRPMWNALHKIVREHITRQELDKRTAELEAEIQRLKKLSQGQEQDQ